MINVFINITACASACNLRQQKFDKSKGYGFCLIRKVNFLI